MTIRISQTYGQIGMESEHAQLRMQHSDARIELKQQHAKLRMETTPAKLTIDQRAAFSSVGLKGIADFADEYVQLGRQQAAKYIDRMVEDGKALSAPLAGTRVFARLAEKSMAKDVQLTIRSLPSPGAKIDHTPAKVHIEWEGNAADPVEETYIPAKLQFDNIPSKLSIYLKQHPSISITVDSQV